MFCTDNIVSTEANNNNNIRNKPESILCASLHQSPVPYVSDMIENYLQSSLERLHPRSKKKWEAVQNSYSKDPEQKVLTQNSVTRLMGQSCSDISRNGAAGKQIDDKSLGNTSAQIL